MFGEDHAFEAMRGADLLAHPRIGEDDIEEELQRRICEQQRQSPRLVTVAPLIPRFARDKLRDDDPSRRCRARHQRVPPERNFVSIACVCWAYRRRGAQVDRSGAVTEWLY